MSASRRSIRLAGLFSGGGRTLLNLIDCIEAGTLPATMELLVASRPDAPGVDRLRERGFDVEILSPRIFPGEDQLHDRLDALLIERRIDLVCLGGYLRLLRIHPSFHNRIMNVHPALLPRFGGKGMYGLRVHRAVLEAGETVSGCSIHFVDEIYDHGPTILQRTCPVLPDDDEYTLAARVFEQECKAYPEAVRLFAEDRLRMVGDQVEILEKARSDSNPRA